ncbi:MAG: ATP-binding cassette domain-containing protein [Steroidobacteraceae bacterium]
MKARLAISLHAVSVRRGAKWVLNDITWRLRPGERWALLGENGAGKTQLLKLLSGEVWPTPRGLLADGRSFRLKGRSVDLIDAKGRIAYIGAERQDKYARYGWNLSVRDLVATGLHQTELLLSPLTSRDVERVSATLRATGLQRYAQRKLLSLSYGERRLALLARALVQNADWLLLDELYNGLDVTFRRRVDAILDEARRRGQSWVATAHRAMDVPQGTGALLELSDGRIHRITRLRRADLARLRARAGEDAPSPPPRRDAMRALARQAPLLLRLAHVDLYVEYQPVLKDLNWQLRRGEHWSVFGANGAGKSSFLKLLYGDLAPALGGRIERSGMPPGAPVAEWKRHVGFVSPELQSLYAVDVSIFELVASGRHSSIGLIDAPSALDRKKALYWLKFFKLGNLKQRRPRELSYGQLRRALIARAMAADARILLLDEPLTGLDPKQRAVMKRLLAQLMKRRLTVIAAVHHAEDLPRGMTHGLHLHKQRAYRSDPYSAT